MADRRSILRGLAALPLAGALPAIAATTQPEPIVDLYPRYLAFLAAGEATADGDVADGMFSAACDLWHESQNARPTTMPGALAALSWARDEFVRAYVDGCKPADWADLWTLDMLNASIAVVREHLEAGNV